MTAVVVEIATKEDAGTVAALLQAEGGLQAAASLADWLGRPGVWVWLARCGFAPAGAAVAVCVPKADTRRGFLFVDELLVLPAFRRRGVARALLGRVEALAGELGLAGVRLLARPENTPARRLYAGAGFIESPAVFLEKRLAGAIGEELR